MQAVTMRSSAPRNLRFWWIAVAAVIASLLVPISAFGVSDRPSGVAAKSLGMDTVKVTWNATAGAANYVVEYSTSSKFSKVVSYPAAKESPVTATTVYVGRLSRGVKYYFRVISVDAAGAKSEPSSTVNAIPNYEYGSVDAIKLSNKGGTFAELEWAFNPGTLGTPGWRIRAENVATSSSEGAHVNDVGSDPNGKVTGLKRRTSYYVRVASLLPKNGSDPAVRLGPYSKALKITTSNYDVDGPSALKLVEQKSNSITLGWTPPINMNADYQYKVQYATNASMTKDVKSAPPTGLAETKVAGLKSNVNYFMRVGVVDRAGQPKSDLSDVIQTKTPTRRGVITGHVDGPPSKDLVVSAYAYGSAMSDNGNLVEESEVDAGGNYRLAVRPGVYRVHVTYVGAGNNTSMWAAKSSRGSIIWAEATNLTVSTDRSTSAPTVTLGAGGTVKGTVTDPRGVTLKSVDVTARSCWSEGSRNKRDVMAQTTTDASGNYQLRGLADGWYWLRFVYNSGDGFGANATAVKIQGQEPVAALASGSSCLSSPPKKSIAEVNVRLAPMAFRTKYAIHVYGSRKTGTTLNTKFNKWIGSQYGAAATLSDMEWVWTRDGKSIAGTSGKSIGNSKYCSRIRCRPRYKLTSKDRGHYVSLKVRYMRYGYTTTTKTYPKFKVR